MCQKIKSQLQKGDERMSYVLNKVLTSKTYFYSPKLVMHSQNFTASPKDTTPNAEAHCVQR